MCQVAVIRPLLGVLPRVAGVGPVLAVVVVVAILKKMVLLEHSEVMMGEEHRMAV